MTRSTSEIGALVAAVLLLSTPAAAAPGGDEARAHFEAGVALLQDPEGARYEEAYREFRAAYDASRSPRVLGNIGLCAMKLERDEEAIDAYERYLAEAPEVDPAEREQIQRDLMTLRRGMVRVTLRVSPPDATVLDVRVPVRGEPVRNSYVARGGTVTLGIRPGHHVLRARAFARESPPWEIDASPGDALEHALVVPPAPPAAAAAPPRPAPSRALPIATLGLGLAALAAGGVTGWLALERVDEISGACPRGECPSTYDLAGAQSRARLYTTATDALLIGGGVLTLGGFTWLLLTGSSGSREKATARAGAACAGTGCFATVGGRF